MDASEALRLSGVVTFVTAADIPGKNSFIVNAGKFPDPVSTLLLISRKNPKVIFCGYTFLWPNRLCFRIFVPIVLLLFM